MMNVANELADEHLRHLTTARLSIVPRTKADTLAMLEGMSAEDRQHVSAEWLALVHGPQARGAWVYGFAVTAREDGADVANAGFKGPPADGVVEIAYAVEPAFRGKGFASEIAAALTAYALSFDEVTCVRAHTLRDGIASQRALIRSGFTFLGVVTDPDDGAVHRFERRR